MKGFQKVMPPCFYLHCQTRYKNDFFYTRFFHVVFPLFSTTNTEPAFRTCHSRTSQDVLKTSAHVRWIPSRGLHINSDALSCHYMAALVWGPRTITLMKHRLFSADRPDRFVVSASLRSSHESWELVFHHVLLVNEVALVAEDGEQAFSTWSLNPASYISGGAGTVFRLLAFNLWVVVMHPTFITCDGALQKIITHTSIASD